MITLGREICGNLAEALRREWLVTNGIGGYASGTVAGVNTRRYHGLLVATLAPPVERTVLVGGTIDWAAYAGERYAEQEMERQSASRFRGRPANFNHGCCAIWATSSKPTSS